MLLEETAGALSPTRPAPLPMSEIAELQSGTCPQRNDRVRIELISRKPSRRMLMKWMFTAALVAAMALASASGADAKGCIKGAIVGGVAGHMAGHGKLGAAAGCVIGHHEANKNPNDSNAQAPSGRK